MTTQTVSQNLRVVADLIEAHPDLPHPYITAYVVDDQVEAKWYLHIDADIRGDLAAQKAAAVRLVTTLGGKWDKGERDDVYALDQVRGGVKLHIEVNRAAVCERVVTGTREVTVPAKPASRAEPERVETVEDVKWICSSLLAEAVSA